MEYVRGIFFKFLLFIIVDWFVFGFIYGVNFGDVLAVSIFMTVFAFLIGDMFVLPAFGNTVAIVADFFIVFFGIWLLGLLYIEEPIRLGAGSFLAAIGISAEEIGFHRYIISRILQEERRNKRKSRNSIPLFDTEFAEEEYWDLRKRKEEE
jgi:Protein of unknown function (DUF2512).